MCQRPGSGGSGSSVLAAPNAAPREPEDLGGGGEAGDNRVPWTHFSYGLCHVLRACRQRTFHTDIGTTGGVTDAGWKNQGVPVPFLKCLCSYVPPREHPTGPAHLCCPLGLGPGWGWGARARRQEAEVCRARCYLFQTASLFLLVLVHKLFQGVFQPRERRNGPVEGRDVDLVNGFGVCGGQAS